MDSIEVPARYFCPNPLGFLTEDDIKNPYGGLKYYLAYEIVRIEEGKAQWVKRSKRCFLQMYWVRFDKKQDDVKKICGKIIFDEFKIFQRSPWVNHSVVDKHGHARLIGPTSPVSGRSIILLYPRLYKANRLGDFYHPENPLGYKKFLKDHEFDGIPDSDYWGIRGNYLWDPKFEKKPYNELIIEEMDTSVGKMRYAYAIIEDGIDSFVTAKLLEWKGEGESVNVYGRICASNTRIDDAKSVIFERKKCEAIPIRPEQYIPIDRPVNIVSTGHSLILRVRIMYIQRVGGSEKCGELVAKEFPIEAENVTDGRGEDGIIKTHELSGPLGKVEFKVYFMPYWCQFTNKVEEDSDDEL